VLVLSTLGAPERRRLRGRRGRTAHGAEPAAVPTARATVVRPEPFGSREEGAHWLGSLRSSGAEAELTAALALVNGALHRWRAASADPYAGDVALERALVARVGLGAGDAVADGRFAEAWEPPAPSARRVRRSMEAPEERFAAMLGGHARTLAGEELVLRARADLDAGRVREAALQARVALEALLAELPGPRAAGLAELRPAAGDAANAALRGEVPRGTAAELARAVEEMEAALRRLRLGDVTRPNE
jgi:hypothetical protein